MCTFVIIGRKDFSPNALDERMMEPFGGLNRSK